jgi:hypothetical protein
MKHLTEDEIDAAALGQFHDAVKKLGHLLECDECFEKYKSALEFIAALRSACRCEPDSSTNRRARLDSLISTRSRLAFNEKEE